MKSPSIDEIRKSVDFNNAHSRVYNEDLFGSADDAEFVIVVQVGGTHCVGDLCL